VKNNTSSVVKDTAFRASYQQLMPKFSLQYYFIRDYMLYATVSKGYRGGGFNTSFVQPEDQSYDAESLWSYETGFKADVLPGKLFVSADVFYIDWKNQQVSQRVLIGGNMYKNAGATSSKGFEAEFKAQPLHGFTMGGNLGYTLAKYQDFQPDKRYDTLNYKNNYLPFVPRYTYAGYISYQRSLAGRAIRSVQCMISLQGIGKQYWDDKNTEAQNPFSLFNASAGAGFHHFKLMIWAKNILSTHYYPYRFFLNNTWYAQAGAPFTTGITLSVELNSNHQ
jgi:outer membrane receptor protein involved in Fe transport